MKLIIDITEEAKEYFDKPESDDFKYSYYDHNGIIGKAIRNGIPLNTVKAEMEKHQFSREYCCDHNIDTAIDMGMVRIILDNIGKESEDK